MATLVCLNRRLLNSPMISKGAHRLQKEALTAARFHKRKFGLRGWKISTWENMGWHWEMFAPGGAQVQLRDAPYSRYTYSMDVSFNINGAANFILEGSSPRAMLKRAQRMVRERMAEHVERATAIEGLTI